MVNISLKYTQRINSCLYPVIQMKVKPHTQRDIRVIHSWALLTFSLSRWIITSRVWKMTFNHILSQIRTTKKIHSVLMSHAMLNHYELCPYWQNSVIQYGGRLRTSEAWMSLSWLRRKRNCRKVLSTVRLPVID